MSVLPARVYGVCKDIRPTNSLINICTFISEHQRRRFLQYRTFSSWLIEVKDFLNLVKRDGALLSLGLFQVLC